MKRVLICGGRDFQNRAMLWKALDRAFYNWGVDTLIHGAAKGADTLASEWAEASSIPVESFPADWKKHGKAAGPIRNQQMLDEGKPDMVIAFPGGRGTADMVSRAENVGVPVYKVGWK